MAGEAAVIGLLEEGFIQDGMRIYLKHELPGYVTYDPDDAMFHGTLVVNSKARGADVRWDHDGKVHSMSWTAKQAINRSRDEPRRDGVSGPKFWGTKDEGFLAMSKRLLPSNHEARFEWTREECMVVLDLYNRVGRRNADDKDPRVEVTSDLLRRMCQEPRPWPAGFRNPGAVALRLSNFSALNADKAGVGMQNYSQVAKDVWEEFHDRPDELARRVAGITAGLEEAPVLPEDDEERTEGRFIARLHKIRERDRKTVKQAKKKFKANHGGRLFCEVCDFDFHKEYGARGEDYIEAHHKVPLSEVDGVIVTKPSDLAMLCANCHRMIHAKRPWLTLDELRRILVQ